MDVVCAVLTDELGRVLICKRAEGKAHAGLWEFPGGKVEPLESDQVALAREIQEELGCAIEVGEALSHVVHEYPTFTIHLRPYRCRLSEAKQQPLAVEHEELAWVCLEQLNSYQLALADQPIAAELRSLGE